MPGELEPSWKEILINELQDDYMAELREFLKNEQNNGSVIYPPNRLIFNAFNHTPFDKVKVVILGQDPYHGEQQALAVRAIGPVGGEILRQRPLDRRDELFRDAR